MRRRGSRSGQRKPRSDALAHFPFVDESGTMGQVLTGKSPRHSHLKVCSADVRIAPVWWRPDGNQFSFFDLDPREQTRQAKKVRRVTTPVIRRPGPVVCWPLEPAVGVIFECARPGVQVFEEVKRGVRGIHVADLPYALRLVGVDLTDRQVERCLPRYYGRPPTRDDGRLPPLA
jgi:hypothetical protein